MRLRNKKTGVVVERTSIVTLREHRTSSSSSLVEAEEFGSIEELNEDWEDYKLKEPLIKDEKIRKAVRAWADANDKRVFEVQVCYQSYGDGSWSLRDTTNEEDCGLAFIGEIPEGLNLGSRYAIAQLCGEEKTCES